MEAVIRDNPRVIYVRDLFKAAGEPISEFDKSLGELGALTQGYIIVHDVFSYRNVTMTWTNGYGNHTKADQVRSQLKHARDILEQQACVTGTTLEDHHTAHWILVVVLFDPPTHVK